MESAGTKGEGEAKKGEERRKEEAEDPGEDKEEILTGHSDPKGNKKISTGYWLPDQEVAIWKEGEGDSLRTKGQSEISSNGPHHFSRGGRGLYVQSF